MNRMNLRVWSAKLLLTGLCVTVGVGVAAAQTGKSYRYSRPTENSASNRVNRLGGLYTNDAASPLQNMRAPGSGTVLGENGFQSGVNRRLPVTGSLGMSMINQQPGSAPEEPVGVSSVVTRFRNKSIDSGELAFEDMMIASGFSAVTRSDSPLRGWRFVPPRPTSPLYPVSAPQQSPFQEFFGLKPAQSAPPVTNPVSLASAMDSNVQDSTRRARERAFALFKSGNYADASVSLEAIRRINGTDYVASLVAMHAALERREISLAVKCLMDAITRKPELFTQNFDIREYYGNPKEAEDKLRGLVRGASEGKMWALHMLGTYAAWQLHDLPTARDFKSRLTQASASGESDNNVAMIRIFCNSAALLDTTGS